ncbi:MAG TPA: metal-dependent hydrolase, partial [Brumimicrobium sp.]|nr:metal-dependent hydrolase [Brumimicrobium sp.]
MNYQLTYGSQTIEFELIYSDRKTLGITVNPDLSVLVKAPIDASKEKIFEKVEKRASWILEQKRYFLSFEP